jgi:hypothetical protein
MSALWYISIDLPAPLITTLNLSGKAGDGVAGTIIYLSDTVILYVVPAGVTSGPVTVTTPNGSITSDEDFIVSPGLGKPFIFKPYPDNLNSISVGEDSSYNGQGFCLSQCGATSNITETRVIVNGVDADIKYLTSTLVAFTIAPGTPPGNQGTQLVAPGGTVAAPAFYVVP